MSAGITDYGSLTWISALLRIAPAPKFYYVALLADEAGPTVDGDMLGDLEPTDTSYRRQLLNAGPANWAASDGFATNIVEVDFDTAQADWGLVNHYALCTAASGGDVLAWGELQNPVYVEAGYTVTVPAGGIVLTLSALESPIAV